MKSKLLSLLLFVGMGAGAWAQEASSSRFYTKFDFGAALQDTADVTELLGFTANPALELEMDPGIRVGLAGGYQFNDSLALELEPGLTYNAIDTIAGTSPGSYDIYQVPVLLSLICRIPMGDHFSAYLGGGAGGVFALLEGDESEDDLTFAWQVQAGAEWAIGENLNLGLGYKLLGTGEIDWAGVMTIDSLLTHSVLASLRLEF
jgi:opacity protein-like surface antigen